MEILIIAIVAGAFALAFALQRARDVLREDAGTDEMQAIAKSIQQGAAAFLRREYTFLAAFVAIVFIVLLLFIDLNILDKVALDDGSDTPKTALSYLVGASLSALAGYLGMTIAVRANVRTAAKARIGLNPALRTAFNSGTVMGMIVVALGILGVTILCHQRQR